MFVWVFFPKIFPCSNFEISGFQSCSEQRQTLEIFQSGDCWCGRTPTFGRTFQDFFCWPSLCYQETQSNCIRYGAPVVSIYTSASGVSANAAIPAQPPKEKLTLRHCLSNLFLFSFISLHWLKNVHLSKIKFELWSSLGLWNFVLYTFILFDFYIHIYIYMYTCAFTHTRTHTTSKTGYRTFLMFSRWFSGPTAENSFSF